MLDKLSKKLIKLAKAKGSTTYNEVCIKCDELNISFTDLNLLCLYLRDSGYLASYTIASRISPYTDVVLSHKGEHCFEFKWLEFKSFIFRSILVPVIVSAVTTLIALFLQA